MEEHYKKKYMLYKKKYLNLKNKIGQAQMGGYYDPPKTLSELEANVEEELWRHNQYEIREIYGRLRKLDGHDSSYTTHMVERAKKYSPFKTLAEAHAHIEGLRKSDEQKDFQDIYTRLSILDNKKRHYTVRSVQLFLQLYAYYDQPKTIAELHANVKKLRTINELIFKNIYSRLFKLDGKARIFIGQAQMGGYYDQHKTLAKLHANIEEIFARLYKLDGKARGYIPLRESR